MSRSEKRSAFTRVHIGLVAASVSASRSRMSMSSSPEFQMPGSLRSMSTIAAGQLVGMTRSAALEFSFLVSIPTMIAATGYDLLRTLHPKHTDVAEAIAPLVMTSHGWIVLFIGFAISFVIALLVVEWFLMWVRRHGFVIFAIYRIALAILLFGLGRKLMMGA